LSDITNQVGEGVETLTRLVEDVRAGHGTVGRLMTDEHLYVELRRFAARAGELTDGLKQGRGTLGRLLNDRRAADALEAALANIETSHSGSTPAKAASARC
jgi:phospholipid/cholesterol/gamma-HCH transport system substrate-binding protein